MEIKCANVDFKDTSTYIDYMREWMTASLTKKKTHLIIVPG